MNINNLVFFDKNGESYNFSQTADDVWEGADYFLPISTALYDVSNIFILEKTENGYRFPVLSPGSKLTFKWKTSESSESLFLFSLEKHDSNRDESDTFIVRQPKLTINYSDLSPNGTSDLDLSYPLQINVGFSPLEEISYTRVLEVYYETQESTSKIASITFYGEGEDEDERFNVWLSNFGIKFNREDALLLKNYDLKEGLPDWKEINRARKELLVNRDQIYPYVGTYKGLINLINILGYREVLRVKEYWRDNDQNSAYYNKFAMVDVTDLMNIGSIDSVNLVDLNGQIKKGGKFKKTEFLALAYEFSVASDNYDDDGLPEVEFTTDFEVDEIFYKLNRLATKLKTEILPVNVVIKDIIGEFIYFNKFNLRNWSDLTLINSLEINEDYQVQVKSPNPKSQLFLIRDIKTLYPKTNNSPFPEITFNTSTIDPYSFGQKYPKSSVPALITAVKDYYANLKNYEFQYHGEDNPMMSGDDADGKVGCPIVLEAYIPDFALQELDGVKFQDFNGSNFTIGNIKYRSGYEIEWNIAGPQGYVFTWRGDIAELAQIPHILPHTGDYTISSTVYDLLGGQSVSYLKLTVLEEEPVMEVFTKIQDKSSYRFSDLTNVTIGDMATSPLYAPFANVVQGANTKSTLTSHYLDWYTYMNNFGLGNPQTEAQIYTEGIGFEPITESLNSVKLYWGTGSNRTGQPTLKDYEDASFKDLSLTRLVDLSYVGDKLNGFILDLPSYTEKLASINFADWNEANSYSVSSYVGADDLANQLNSATHPHVSEYRYVSLNGRIHAQAKRQDKTLHRILKLTDVLDNSWTLYTFCEPSFIHNPFVLQQINDQLLTERNLQIDTDLLFLTAPFEDILHEPGQSAKAANIQYWIDKGFIEFTEIDTANVKVRGYLPSNYDQNSLTLNNLKIGLNGLVVPLHQPIFVAISNIESKREVEWSLTLYDKEVVRLRTSSYFVWRFANPGQYKLSAKVIDTNNNEYSLLRSFNVADAKNITEYRNFIEKTLNRRKALV